MKTLLHACCGPCSLEPTRILREQGHDLSIFYTNSNIHPDDEYQHRLNTLQAWAADEQLPVIEGVYDREAWESGAGAIGEAAVAQLEDDQTILDIDPDRRAARCRACYRMRLEEAAEYAVAHGFEGLGTTLSVSPYQYTDIIREETQRAADNHGLTAVFEDFRPYYPEATRRSKELGMYRQNYCGCRFSEQEAEEERAQRKAERKAAREAELASHAEERAAEEAARQARKNERAEYDSKQARKRTILKELREKQKGQ